MSDIERWQANGIYVVDAAVYDELDAEYRNLMGHRDQLWKERDEIRQQLQGAVTAERARVITRIEDAASLVDADEVSRTSVTLRKIATLLAVEGRQ